MAKNRKPSPPSAQSPESPASSPADAGHEGDLAGDFPDFAPGDLPDTSQSTPPPQSPSPPADGDITLEEYEDRHQQRPRLPDHRREKQSFEMSASIAPPREFAAHDPLETLDPESRKTPASNLSPPDTATDQDEIAAYDPLAVEMPASPSGEAAPRPRPAHAVEIPSTPGLDDLEEFIAKTASEGPPKENEERVRRPFTLVEKICTAAGIAILITAAVWLITSITREANGVPAASTPWPNLPMKGSLITISEASSSWRKRTDTDRVAQMEVILPVPGQQMPGIIPQVNFTIDSDKSSAGFLRFIFKDPAGKPRGDTRVVQVEGGKLKDMGKGEIIKGGTEGLIYCSYGLLNIAAYRSYEGDEVPRWSVEVAESASYNADDKDWKILGTFNVRNDLDE